MVNTRTVLREGEDLVVLNLMYPVVRVSCYNCSLLSIVVSLVNGKPPPVCEMETKHYLTLNSL